MNKKKIVFLILSCVITSQIMLPTLSVSANELNQPSRENVQTRATDLNRIIHMPDANLRKALNTKYLHQAEDAPITQRQLQYLKGTLYLGNSGISDLTGLEYCKGVTGLYLNYNKIKDLSPLKKLKNLKRLNVTNQEINEKDVVAINGAAEVDNVVKGISGKYVVPTKNNEYAYNSANNKIIFKNITESGMRSYSFNERFTYGSGYTTYFSGNVTQNIISNNPTPIDNFIMYNSNAEIKKGYWNEDNFIINGVVSIENKGLDQYNNETLIIRDDFENLIYETPISKIDLLPNEGDFSEFQAIIPKEIIEDLTEGQYYIEIKTKINNIEHINSLKQNSSAEDINLTEGKMLNGLTYKFATDIDNNVILDIYDLSL